MRRCDRLFSAPGSISVNDPGTAAPRRAQRSRLKSPARNQPTTMSDGYRGFKSRPSPRLPASVFVFSCLGRGICGGSQPTLSAALAACGLSSMSDVLQAYLIDRSSISPFRINGLQAIRNGVAPNAPSRIFDLGCRARLDRWYVEWTRNAATGIEHSGISSNKCCSAPSKPNSPDRCGMDDRAEA